MAHSFKKIILNSAFTFNQIQLRLSDTISEKGKVAPHWENANVVLLKVPYWIRSACVKQTGNLVITHLIDRRVFAFGNAAESNRTSNKNNNSNINC